MDISHIFTNHRWEWKVSPATNGASLYTVVYLQLLLVLEVHAEITKSIQCLHFNLWCRVREEAPYNRNSFIVTNNILRDRGYIMLEDVFLKLHKNVMQSSFFLKAST